MKGFVAAAGLLLALATAAAADPPMLQPGARFPLWTLYDHTGKQVSSKDLAGKSYLLWFYPRAGTHGTRVEADGFRNHLEEFRAKKVEIFGVSFESAKDNAAFAAEEGLPYPLLSDTDRSLGLAVGAADRRKEPAARRMSYLVGPDGKVRKVYVAVNGRTHPTDVLADLAAADATPIVSPSP